jgi:hypothetical protein
MITQSPDTHPKMEARQIALIRRASIARRISIVRSLSESTLWLSRRAIERANPELDQRGLDLEFVAYHYGDRLAGRLREYMDTRSL